MTAAGEPSSVRAIADAFRDQVRWCDRLGSPFTARLLEWCMTDWQAGGATRHVLPDWTLGSPATDLVPLRLAGGLHALALSGRHPELSALYPPAAKTFDAARVAAVLPGLIAAQDAHLRHFLASAPQTNEVLRSAVLIGGYAHIARQTGLPLVLREIGASAGLNLLWDRFRYVLNAQRFGDPSSAVRLVSDWRGAAPALPERIEVADRRGNDLAPIDPADPAAALRLAAYVWPDQPERLARLRGALAVAARELPVVDRGDAAAWVAAQLAAPRPGAVTVLVHSVVWQYLPPATRNAIRSTVEQAGAHASLAAPLAWLHMEFHTTDAPAELRLTLWPGGVERTLACTHAHGAWVEWFM